MSIKLMASAWELDIPSAEKMVLLCLCDFAGDHGSCWPSIKTIARKCSKSERTVQGAIQWLRAHGYCDWNDIPGKPHQFALNPEKICEGGLHWRHYVYRIDDPETGEFYIGARSCQGAIEKDSYMGSGNWPVSARHVGRRLRKTILEILDTRDQLAIAEQRHVALAVGLPGCKNRKVSAPGSLPGTPADSAPLFDIPPQKLRQTPADSAPKPLRTTITKKEARELPDDWQPRPFGEDTESRKVVDGWPPGEFGRQLEHFRAHQRKTGNRFKDWQAAWSTWVLNSVKFGGKNGQRQSDGLSATTRAAADVFGPCDEPRLSG